MADDRGQSRDGQPVTPSAGLHTIGERLRWAIEARPSRGRQRGIRLFQRDMEARADALEAEGRERPPGVTLASIQTYLPREDGTPEETEPSVAFLREAARILGVREPWLISGDGAPTEVEEALRREADRRRRGELERAAIDGFSVGLDQPFDAVPPVAQEAIWRLWAALRGSLVEHVGSSKPPGTYRDQSNVDRELARRIAVAIRRPLEPFRFHLDEHRVSSRRWGRYLAGACEALYALLAYPSPPEEEPVPVDWRAFIESREEQDDAEA